MVVLTFGLIWVAEAISFAGIDTRHRQAQCDMMHLVLNERKKNTITMSSWSMTIHVFILIDVHRWRVGWVGD